MTVTESAITVTGEAMLALVMKAISLTTDLLMDVVNLVAVIAILILLHHLREREESLDPMKTREKEAGVGAEAEAEVATEVAATEETMEEVLRTIVTL